MRAFPKETYLFAESRHKCFQGPFFLLTFALLPTGRGPIREQKLNLLILKKNLMEHLNRIELRGVIGTVKTQNFSGSKMSRFSVATSRAYKDKEGVAQIDTTWHTVVAWENDRIKGLDKLQQGTKVYVIGRLQSHQYTGQDGVERTSFEVIASKVEIIELDEPLQYQF